MAKDKDSGFRIMGFGHRVYKNFDPRAKIIEGACKKILQKQAEIFEEKINYLISVY